MTRPPVPKPEPSPPNFFSPQVSVARRFYLDLAPPPSTALAVVCGGCEHCSPDYAVERSAFPFYSIEYVAFGRGSLRLGNQETTLHPGCAFAYGPAVPHHIRSDPEEPLVKYFVDFTGRRVVELLRSCDLSPGRSRRCTPPHDLLPLFEEIIRSGQRGTRASQALCCRLLECLLLKLSESRVPVDGPEMRAFTTFQTCRHYIHEHFRRLRTLEQIATECHVNAAYLCRLFRRFDHQTPHQYLLRLKMNLAAELLEHPQTLVKQAAEAVGFGDPFHFSRAFKAVFGLAPDSFRRLR